MKNMSVINWVNVAIWVVVPAVGGYVWVTAGVVVDALLA